MHSNSACQRAYATEARRLYASAAAQIEADRAERLNSLCMQYRAPCRVRQRPPTGSSWLAEGMLSGRSDPPTVFPTELAALVLGAKTRMHVHSTFPFSHPLGEIPKQKAHACVFWRFYHLGAQRGMTDRLLLCVSP